MTPFEQTVVEGFREKFSKFTREEINSMDKFFGFGAEIHNKLIPDFEDFLLAKLKEQRAELAVELKHHPFLKPKFFGDISKAQGYHEASEVLDKYVDTILQQLEKTEGAG